VSHARLRGSRAATAHAVPPVVPLLLLKEFRSHPAYPAVVGPTHLSRLDLGPFERRATARQRRAAAVI